MNTNGWESTCVENLVESFCSFNSVHKNDDLVELDCIQDVMKLSSLLFFSQFDCILFKAVKGKFLFFINEDFKWILEELSADWFDLVAHGC